MNPSPAASFRKALIDAFVARSGLIFLALLSLYGFLFLACFEISGPLPPADPAHLLQAASAIAAYGLAGLMIGSLVWIGLPLLVLSGIIWLTKIMR